MVCRERDCCAPFPMFPSSSCGRSKDCDIPSSSSVVVIWECPSCGLGIRRRSFPQLAATWHGCAGRCASLPKRLGLMPILELARLLT